MPDVKTPSTLLTEKSRNLNLDLNYSFYLGKQEVSLKSCCQVRNHLLKSSCPRKVWSSWTTECLLLSLISGQEVIYTAYSFISFMIELPSHLAARPVWHWNNLSYFYQ